MLESLVPSGVMQLACHGLPGRTAVPEPSLSLGEDRSGPPAASVCKADPSRGVHRPDACSRKIHKVRFIQNIHSISQRMGRGCQAARTRAREWLVNAACGPRLALHFGPRRVRAFSSNLARLQLWHAMQGLGLRWASQQLRAMQVVSWYAKPGHLCQRHSSQHRKEGSAPLFPWMGGLTSMRLAVPGTPTGRPDWATQRLGIQARSRHAHAFDMGSPSNLRSAQLPDGLLGRRGTPVMSKHPPTTGEAGACGGATNK